MRLAEWISAAVIPAVLLCAAIPMLSRRRDFFAAFTAGARAGLETSVRLLPALVALMTGLSMLEGSGLLAALSDALRGPAAALGIPAELIPLLLTRPVSGAGSTAAYAAMLEKYGADSYPALCAAVLLGSSDTMLYVISVYFSGTGSGGLSPVRRTRYAFPAAAAIMLLCIFLSCAAARVIA